MPSIRLKKPMPRQAGIYSADIAVLVAASAGDEAFAAEGFNPAIRESTSTSGARFFCAQCYGHRLAICRRKRLIGSQ